AGLGAPLRQLRGDDGPRHGAARRLRARTGDSVLPLRRGPQLVRGRFGARTALAPADRGRRRRGAPARWSHAVHRTLRGDHELPLPLFPTHRGGSVIFDDPMKMISPYVAAPLLRCAALLLVL